MSIGKTAAEALNENSMPPAPEEEAALYNTPAEPQSILLPPRARGELKSLLRWQSEAQERVRLVLATLEEALDVPAGWMIRDVDEGFVKDLGSQLPGTQL